jgi:hypothetical protein
MQPNSHASSGFEHCETPRGASQAPTALLFYLIAMGISKEFADGDVKSGCADGYAKATVPAHFTRWME